MGRSLVFLLLVCGALADSRLTTKRAKTTANKAITFPDHAVQLSTAASSRAKLYDVLFRDDFSIRGPASLVMGRNRHRPQYVRTIPGVPNELLIVALIAKIILVILTSTSGGSPGTFTPDNMIVDSSNPDFPNPPGLGQDFEENPFSGTKVPDSPIDDVIEASDVNSLDDVNSFSEDKVPDVNSFTEHKVPDVNSFTDTKEPESPLIDVKPVSVSEPLDNTVNEILSANPELVANLAFTILPSLLPLLSPEGREAIDTNLIMDKTTATAFARMDGVKGELFFAQIKPTQYGRESTTVIAGALKGFKPLTNYKISLHQSGDTSDDCSNVGRPFTGTKEHQFKTDTEGRSVLLLHESGLRIRGKDGIMGRSVVITDPQGAEARHCGIVINA